MGEFTTIINRIGEVRNSLVNAIKDQGGSATTSMSFAELARQVYNIPAGIDHIRSGYQIFKGNEELTELPSHLDFRTFTTMYQMCYGCIALKRIGQLETGNVTNMLWAFWGCSSLEYIDGLDTRSITSASELFHGCSSLHSIYSPLDFSNVTSQIDTTFTSCKALVNLSFTGTIKADVMVHGCPNLSKASLLSLINALSPAAIGKICRLGSTNLAKLTAAEKAIITDKGWSVE